ncbi:MFS transporter [Paenibacillus glycinis]|uniref:MFS transporter n=1 Tax=Paenibacillus glycinis TaxID=2697035 RepID=A0ABW9XZG2_9BACL|nr:MFS transporter [Paenibacillus glycinis]NBD28009.1 MFS transporter [Paenibacillus glycinis]
MDNKRKATFWIYVIALGLFSIINTEFGVIGIIPYVVEKYQVSVAQAGLLVSLFALTIAISGPIMTLLLSGINRKTIMLLVLAIFALANALAAFSTSFNVLLLLRIVPAFLHPVYFSLAFVVAASFYPNDGSKAIAKVFTGGTIGLVLGVPITSFIASRFSLEASFLFSAMINIIGFIGLAVFITSLPVTTKLTYRSQLRVLAKPSLWFNIATLLLMVAAMFSVYSYFSAYLTKYTGLDNKWISMMLVVFGISGVIGNLQTGKFLSKSVTRTAVFFPIIMVLIYLLVYFAGHAFIPMILIVILWEAVHTSGFVISQSWFTTEASEAPEFGNSLFVSFSNLGISVGSIAGGWTISHYGTHNILLTGIVLFGAALLTILLKVKLFGVKDVAPGSPPH